MAEAPAAHASGANRRKNLMQHPAVVAWCQLHPDAEPQRITPLRVRRTKNRVYRLEGASWGRTAVIAKWGPPAAALIQRTAYGEILPRATAPPLHHHRSLQGPGGAHCWLFLSEGTGAHHSN